MKDSKEAGIVLLTTIILIGLVALLVLSQLQLVLLDFRVLNLGTKKQQALLKLELAANQLLKNDIGEQNLCLVNETYSEEIVNLLKNKKGCSLNYAEQHYNYLVEDLGIFPCLQKQRNDKHYATRHFRLSIREAENEQEILQMRYAKIDKELVCEDKKPVQSKIGLLSWRYFN